MGPTWGPAGSCQPQMGPMLAPWTLLSEPATVTYFTCTTVRNRRHNLWFRVVIYTGISSRLHNEPVFSSQIRAFSTRLAASNYLAIYLTLIHINGYRKNTILPALPLTITQIAVYSPRVSANWLGAYALRDQAVVWQGCFVTAAWKGLIGGIQMLKRYYHIRQELAWAWNGLRCFTFNRIFILGFVIYFYNNYDVVSGVSNSGLQMLGIQISDIWNQSSLASSGNERYYYYDGALTVC